jgi:hypothetical protein
MGKKNIGTLSNSLFGNPKQIYNKGNIIERSAVNVWIITLLFLFNK